MAAAAKGNTAIVHMLLEAGARRSLYDKVVYCRCRDYVLDAPLSYSTSVSCVCIGLCHRVRVCRFRGDEGSHRYLWYASYRAIVVILACICLIAHTVMLPVSQARAPQDACQCNCNCYCK
jgi:hypothetical protein